MIQRVSMANAVHDSKQTRHPFTFQISFSIPNQTRVCGKQKYASHHWDVLVLSNQAGKILQVLQLVEFPKGGSLAFEHWQTIPQ